MLVLQQYNPLKGKDGHGDYFAVTDCPWGGLHDHLKGSQWLQSSHCDYLSVSRSTCFIYGHIHDIEMSLLHICMFCFGMAWRDDIDITTRRALSCVATSFWRDNDVIIAPFVRWGTCMGPPLIRVNTSLDIGTDMYMTQQIDGLAQ